MWENQNREKKVVRTLKEYHRAVCFIKYHNDGYLLLQEQIDEATLIKLYAIIAKVEAALQIVEEETTFFVYHEFIGSGNKDWWREFFSRSTYYRHKKRAIMDFWDCYNL